jgi:hypothetical protein
LKFRAPRADNANVSAGDVRRLMILQQASQEAFGSQTESNLDAFG